MYWEVVGANGYFREFLRGKGNEDTRHIRAAGEKTVIIARTVAKAAAAFVKADAGYEDCGKIFRLDPFGLLWQWGWDPVGIWYHRCFIVRHKCLHLRSRKDTWVGHADSILP